ncbi:MAG: metallophosphoesterase [Gemmataceae bacterium]
MNRRSFLKGGTASVGLAPSLLGAGAPGAAQEVAGPQAFTAGSGPGPVFGGSPVVTGPAADAITVLQPLQRHATGFLEYAVEGGAFRRVDAARAGLLPYEQYVLKFRLPPLPPGKAIRYRVTARSVGWVNVREFKYGKIEPGKPEAGPVFSFRTLDPEADTTSFVVWNDTHEQPETLRKLHAKTAEIRPDFLLWNGDQTNDVNEESRMRAQFLAPEGLAVADRWPLAYVRGNHDVRGPKARLLHEYTGTPGDRFYYAFRSGPVAALVLDTGEDKPDDSEWLGGVTAFAAMRREQAEWLKQVVREPWFRDAPHRVLFCHIPLWWVRDRKGIDWWEYSRPCRDAWEPLLAAAGVKVVVSGHTHDHTWMPAGKGQSIGQFVGGGPQPRHATVIHGTATRKALTLKMSKLDGAVVAEVTLKA